MKLNAIQTNLCILLTFFGTATAACGPSDFQMQCSSTSQCQGIYEEATDCSNSKGGVCFCGDDVCGCEDFSVAPSSAPTMCEPERFQSECTNTQQCQGLYPKATDCSNSGGGVCYCGDEACGCAAISAMPSSMPSWMPSSMPSWMPSSMPSSTPSSAPTVCGPKTFAGECTTTAQCMGMYTGANDCSNNDGGICLCDGKACGCKDVSSMPSSAPTTCGPQHFQKECSNTVQCQQKYAGAKDCWNAAGGVCLCGGMDKVCGCL